MLRQQHFVEAVESGGDSGDLDQDIRAETKGDRVILTFEKLPEDPVDISFVQGAWYQINLFNSAGIPAIPFQITV